MSRETYETDGLVLKESKYGENDSIVSLLTPDKGVIAFFAKNIAKSKKNRIFAQPFTYARYELKNNGGVMDIFSSAEMKDSFYNIRRDMCTLATGQYVLEVSYLLREVPDNAEQYLKLALNSLYLLATPEKNVSYSTVKLVFELTFLQLSGLMPNSRVCVGCGRSPKYWSFDDGFICRQCFEKEYNSRAYEMTHEMFSVIRHISDNDGIAKYRFIIDDTTRLRISTLLQKYMEYKFETHFKSTGFIL